MIDLPYECLGGDSYLQVQYQEKHLPQFFLDPTRTGCYVSGTTASQIVKQRVRIGVTTRS